MKSTNETVKRWNTYVEEALLAQERYRKPNGQKVILENIIALKRNEESEVPMEHDCPFLEKELWISATGKISPCCAPDNLRLSLGDFGNIESVTIDQVLKSEKYLDLVANYKTKSLCKTCNMRKPSTR